MRIPKEIRDLIFLILITLSTVFVYQACNKDSDSPTSSSSSSSSGNCPNGRSGAVCNDGTTSTATGSGACSQHGGVKNWLCN
jgi:hypothetical protein